MRYLEGCVVGLTGKGGFGCMDVGRGRGGAGWLVGAGAELIVMGEVKRAVIGWLVFGGGRRGGV